MAHANARLTVHGRLLLVQRVVRDQRPVAHVAKEMGISRQCAHRWVARYRAEGEAGLHERSSRPASCPRRTPARVERRVEAARRLLRVGRDQIAVVTRVPARTVSRILTRRFATLTSDAVGQEAAFKDVNSGLRPPVLQAGPP